MTTKLLSLITNLRTNRKITEFDEAATKQVVILQLLAMLGWDYFNVDEVKPEYTVGSRKVDYALRLSNMNKVFIEVKRIGEPLEKHQEQLLNYSFKEGVKLAILTNGITWWFYLPLNEGSWEQRRFYTVDLLQQEPSDISKRFIAFLSKENVSNGQAIENAEKLYKSQQKKNILQATFPKAWNKIVTEPDEFLIELIAETTEKISGFRPQADTVEQFLAKYKNQFYISDKDRFISPTKTGTKPPTQKTSYKKQSFKQITPGSPPSFLGKSITGFKFCGTPYQVKTWKELLIILSEIMYQTHTSEFDKVFSLRGTKRVYYSKNPNQMREPAKVGRTGIYVETHWSANATVTMCLNLIALFEYSDHDLELDVKEKRYE